MCVCVCESNQDRAPGIKAGIDKKKPKQNTDLKMVLDDRQTCLQQQAEQHPCGAAVGRQADHLPLTVFVSGSQVKKLTRHLDPNSHGKINFKDFCHGVFAIKGGYFFFFFFNAYCLTQ